MRAEAAGAPSAPHRRPWPDKGVNPGRQFDPWSFLRGPAGPPKVRSHPLPCSERHPKAAACVPVGKVAVEATLPALMRHISIDRLTVQTTETPIPTAHHGWRPPAIALPRPVLSDAAPRPAIGRRDRIYRLALAVADLAA